MKKDYDIELIHRGFEIHSDVPETGMPISDYLPDADKMIGQLRSMGAPYGLEFNTITMMPNTNKALQIGEYAKEVGKSISYNAATYKATFVDNINISSVIELKKIAKSVGISEKEVDQVLSNDHYKDILVDNKTYCQQNKIASVPTFIINGQNAVVGAQSPDRFKEIFNNLKNGTTTF